MGRRQTLLPVYYRLYFLVIEPLIALGGAFYAHFRQESFLSLTHADSAPSPVPLGTSIVMTQLANMYVVFALIEILVLRRTADMAVWKTVLFVFLVADVGHLVSVSPLGSSIYWDFSRWNILDWGNVPLVYFCASMRIAFLSGLGMPAAQREMKAGKIA